VDAIVASGERHNAGPAIARLSVGQAFGLAVGDPGSCFESIEQHLRAVAAMPDFATSDSPPR
jgi:hypothetical protein